MIGPSLSNADITPSTIGTSADAKMVFLAEPGSGSAARPQTRMVGSLSSDDSLSDQAIIVGAVNDLQATRPNLPPDFSGSPTSEIKKPGFPRLAALPRLGR
jgi:hypothetical protein